MINLLESMILLKWCLLFILLIGFIFGYFYSRLKAKEIYHPTIKELRLKIAQQVDQTHALKEKYKEIETEVLIYENKLKKLNQSIKKIRENVMKKEGLRVTLESEHYKLGGQYEEKNKILDYYENEMDEIKSACRVDNLSNLDENRERLEKLIASKKEKLAEVKKHFDKVHIEFEEAIIEKSKLKKRKNFLEKELQYKISAYEKYQKKSKALRVEWAEEYAHLKRKRRLILERIENYKNKIDVLRVTQG